MEGEASSVFRPFHNLGMLMQAEVIHDHVEMFVRIAPVKMLEEVEEGRMVVPVHATSCYFSAMDGEGGKETGCAVSFVGGRLPFGIARPHGQLGLGPIKRLEL